MTSNAGVQTKEVQVGFATENNAWNEASILDSLGQFFKPEFLNRVDNIVEFKSLTKEHLLTITDLLLKELNAVLAQSNIHLNVTDEVKAKLAQLGYHPAFGARPLRRVIQEQLEDKIADKIIDEEEQSELSAVLEEGNIVIQ